MKKIFSIVAVMVMALLPTACLDANLDDIESYHGHEVTGVYGVYHRYIDEDDTIAGSGEPAVQQVQLSSSNVQIDAEAGTVTFDVALPSGLPASQVGKVSKKSLVVSLNISTASVVTPVDGSPALGVPADWTKPNKYKVTAADGSSQVWTVSVANFTGTGWAD